MHIDCYYQPPPQRPYQNTPRRTERANTFVYTGDQFIFSPPPPQAVTPRVQDEPGFWAWLGQLFR